MNDRVSTGGPGPVRIHDQRRVPRRPATRSEFSLDVHQHIEQHLGSAPEVFHDLLSDLVHLDIYPVPPGEGRLGWTLVTNGMSGAPMRMRYPDGATRLAHAELSLALPGDWPILDPRNHGARWPLAMLSEIAMMPHAFDTWIAPGHTIANGMPPEPYAPETRFSGALVTRPSNLPPSFSRLRVREDVVIEFHAIIPLLADEIRLAPRMGAQEFAGRLAARGVTEMLDPGRESVA